MGNKKKINFASELLEVSPFAGIAEKLGYNQSSEDPTERSGKIETDPVAGIGTVNRVILRKERKGRGGKTVTVVEVRPADGVDLKKLSRELKNALGCGGKIEKDLIILQGDITGRVMDFFSNKGIRKITTG